jgi:prepilin-type processing-associated H-X9-DG protein
MNNMKQIGMAMINYADANGNYPPAAIEKDGKPLLSWRVAILPYVEQDALYRQFHLDEPWDSPHNLKLAKILPAVFQSPDSPGEGKTRVMLFTGKGAAFDGGKKIRMADIHDGTSGTILCVEAGPDKAVPWTKPEDLPFNPEKPLAALGKVSAKGFNVAFFDGHVEQVKVDNRTLAALITPDGAEVIDFSKLHGGP